MVHGIGTSSKRAVCRAHEVFNLILKIDPDLNDQKHTPKKNRVFLFFIGEISEKHVKKTGKFEIAFAENCGHFVCS